MSERGERPGRAVARALAGALLALALIGLGPPPLVAAEVAASKAPMVPDATSMALSGGCGQPAPAAAPAAVEVKGRSRDLITVVPAGYRPDQPHRLVVAFHGRTNSNAKARGYFGLEEAARGPTIFVYPSGLRSHGGYSWAAPDDAAGALRDFALFDAVVARISSLYCIDSTQVFAVGHSLGAWFVNSLGCARGYVLRAIGTIAGGISRSDCRGEVAALLFHNPRDRQVHYRYGLAARDRLRVWNGFGKRAEQVSWDGFECERYGAAVAPNPVLWCPYTSNRNHSGRYYPHHWPDGAGRAIMDFFAALPGAATAAAIRPAAGGPPG